ncbi:MAG: hypothetical protein Q7S59_06225 [Sulfurimonas sp.]|nr:hypothetical protein [Sulfurimonas sp.]
MKLLVSIFVIVFLCSCGVDTSSNSANSSATTNGDIGIGLDLIDPNPIHSDSNTTNDNNSTDDNSSNGGGSTVTPESDFDTVGAIYDASACNASTYQIARDASYNGVNVGENGSDFFSVKSQGLEIRSEHLEGDSVNGGKTWVTLFYKSFPDIRNLNLQGYTSYVMDGVFFLTYDIAWSDKSIAGIDNTMYVQSAITTKPSCYRLILNNVVGTQISMKKVYR